eukprot:CAMPEP_0172882930 /NCGR_PEP_ID=MMETSP1075-20121228/121428_1 /TAXON_ID=2916 /ORGANISM="Ceratium fusus, Strain PA161109" /LENGTH=46 /DNA_ID= /DNA_START= /DNA_END= /DNA_ORIENTATION=
MTSFLTGNDGWLCEVFILTAAEPGTGATFAWRSRVDVPKLKEGAEQ